MRPWPWIGSGASRALVSESTATLSILAKSKQICGNSVVHIAPYFIDDLVNSRVAGANDGRPPHRA